MVNIFNDCMFLDVMYNFKNIVIGPKMPLIKCILNKKHSILWGKNVSRKF
jgi:hypothetical protein